MIPNNAHDRQHAMPDRFFSEIPIKGDTARLTGPEAHHLVHVMRATAGTRVVLFDGSGAEFQAEVHRTGRNEVELTILDRTEVDRELPTEIVLGVSLPKGDRQRWLVEKAVELGVGCLVPLHTTRSLGWHGPQAAARLCRAVVEASKQCGRNRLMEIALPQDWADWVATDRGAAVRLVAHPGGQAIADESRGIPFVEHVSNVPGTLETCPNTSPPAGQTLLAVGPEGGFTAEEVDLAAAAGWRVIDLGPRILRVETAAIYLVATAVARK